MAGTSAAGSGAGADRRVGAGYRVRPEGRRRGFTHSHHDAPEVLDAADGPHAG